MGSRYRMRDLSPNPPADITGADIRAIAELGRAIKKAEARRADRDRKPAPTDGELAQDIRARAWDRHRQRYS